MRGGREALARSGDRRRAFGDDRSTVRPAPTGRVSPPPRHRPSAARLPAAGPPGRRSRRGGRIGRRGAGRARGRRGRPGGAGRDRAHHAGRALAGALEVRRRTRLAQVREPAAHGQLQDSRCLPAHRASRAGGPRAGGRRRERRQPRAGRGAGRPPARHPGHGVHAGRCAAAEARRDPGLRRRRAARRHLRRDARGRGGVRGAHRRGADPPLRPPRHRRGAGHRRARDPRAGARTSPPSSCAPAAAG